MTIVVIQGPSQSGKTLIANALRDKQISNKRGALMIDETSDGDLCYMLEKVISNEDVPYGFIGRLADDRGNWLKDTFDATKVNWKPNASIIVVGDRVAILDEIEERIPGFKAAFGPTYTVTTGVG